MPANMNSDDKEITVASTTDSQEAVDAAAGVEKEEAEAAEQEEKTEVESSEEGTEEASEESEEEESSEEAETDSESETEEETEEAEEGEEAKKGTSSKGKGKLRKRVDKLTAKLRQTERELAAERAKKATAAEEESEQEETPAASTTAGFNKPKPKQSSFKDGDGKPDIEAYVEAYSDWKAEKQDFERKQEAETTRIKGMYGRYNETLASIKDEYDDWDEVSEKALPIPSAVEVAIIDSENPLLAYELAKDPELCKKMQEMTPSQAVRALGKLEAALEARTASASEPPKKAATKAAAASAGTAPKKKTPSTAPTPIKPVGGSSTKGSVKPLDAKDVSYQEYKQRREAGER